MSGNFLPFSSHGTLNCQHTHHHPFLVLIRTVLIPILALFQLLLHPSSPLFQTCTHSSAHKNSSKISDLFLAATNQFFKLAEHVKYSYVFFY